jgi:hypothetical protein
MMKISMKPMRPSFLLLHPKKNFTNTLLFERFQKIDSELSAKITRLGARDLGADAQDSGIRLSVARMHTHADVTCAHASRMPCTHMHGGTLHSAESLPCTHFLMVHKLHHCMLEFISRHRNKMADLSAADFGAELGAMDRGAEVHVGSTCIAHLLTSAPRFTPLRRVTMAPRFTAPSLGSIFFENLSKRDVFVNFFYQRVKKQKDGPCEYTPALDSCICLDFGARTTGKPTFALRYVACRALYIEAHGKAILCRASQLQRTANIYAR